MDNAATTLDVDRIGQWGPTYAPFFAQLADSHFWTELLSSEEYNGVQSRESALTHRVPNLRKRATAFLRDHFTHLDLFHGCRIVDEASYLTYGLLPSDTAALLRIAREVFGDSPELAAAIKDLDGSGYRSHNHGKVYLFFARSGVEHIGAHYLESGSEYLRAIASRLPDGARELLQARGRSAIVRCRLALEQLDTSDLSYAAMLPIRQKLTVRDPEAPPRIYAVQGGFAYPRAIPPECLQIEYTENP